MHRPSKIHLTRHLFLSIASLGFTLCFTTPLFGEAVEWGDGASNPFWSDATNWSGSVVPGAEDSVVFAQSKGLRGKVPQMVVVTEAIAKTVTVNLPAWAARPSERNSRLDITGGELRFTEAFTAVGAYPTFFGGLTPASLRLRFGANLSHIVNDGSGTVVFSDKTKGAIPGFGFASIGDKKVNLLLTGEGSGGFLLEGGAVFPGIRRFGTAPGFKSTFTISGGILRMSLDLFAGGGTIRITGNDLIHDKANLSFGSLTRPEDAVIDIRGVHDVVSKLNAFEQGGTLLVDDKTNFTFDTYNGGPLLIEGFVEGSTILQFNGMEENAPIDNLKINGEPASLTWNGQGNGSLCLLSPQSAGLLFALRD